MPEVRWFDVELNTLTLGPISGQTWPAALESASTRMCEECFESLVALNLDTLFPDEALLLIAVQEQMIAAADVMAVDPLGIIRLIELKKTAVKRGELESQVISYGIASHELRAWPRELASGMTDLPERLSLMIEGFRCNQRAKAVSKEWLADHLPEARFQGANRFERLPMKVAALRNSRKAGPPLDALKDPAVADLCERLYATKVAQAAWQEPEDTAAAIIKTRFSMPPAAGFTEFTMVAPGLAREFGASNAAASDASALEKRRACFNLVDGDLRCVMKQNAVQRAILRWEPVHRTFSTRTLCLLVALRNYLAAQGEYHAASFVWNPGREWIYWPHLRGPFMFVSEEPNGEIWIQTWAEWVTEGLAELKAKRRQSQREIGKKLASHGIENDGGELCVPLSKSDMRSAALLVREYYDLVTAIGFGDPYRWHRRPKA